jgi:hypothetical protein
MQIGGVIIYLEITHYNLTLIQTSYTLSQNHIQYHTHQLTQIYYTHSILSQFSNICGIGSQANRQGNKTNIARTHFLNSKYQTFESSSFDCHNTSDGGNFTSINYGQFRLRKVSSYGKYHDRCCKNRTKMQPGLGSSSLINVNRQKNKKEERIEREAM